MKRALHPYPLASSGPPPGLGLRLRVALRRGRLDRDLADGLPPDSFDDRALRAVQLAGMPERHRVAHAFRALVKRAERPELVTAAVPVSRRAVVRWRESLLGLAERLERPDPVNPCGVARALVLLTDGGGPLYARGAAGSMSDVVWWIADGLRPCPPHDWGCPVLMKLDPEHVAWTCARCGAIATSDDGAQRPS
jgi:hypothetical protein